MLLLTEFRFNSQYELARILNTVVNAKQSKIQFPVLFHKILALSNSSVCSLFYV